MAGAGEREGGRIRNTFHLLLFITIFEADMTSPDRTDGFLCQNSEEVEEAKRNQCLTMSGIFSTSEIVLLN